MAAAIRREDPPVSEVLFAEPYRFSFFQAVRLLERLAPGRAPIGRVAPPRREVARFHALPSLLFPPSEIHALTRPEDESAPFDMTVAFLGLIGPSGALPTVYTELVIERLRAGDRTLAAFLDLFQHRMISYFYRAWEKYRPAIAHERGDRDRFADWLFALSGLGLEPLRDRHEVLSDAALLPWSGAFARRQRPVVVLEAMLSDYFRRPVAVLPFLGRWLPIDPADQSRPGIHGAFHQLGTSLVIGARTWDEQSKFRLRIGPLTYEQFTAFLPGQGAFRALCELTRQFVDAEFDFDVQLVLKADEVPPCRLGGPEAGAVRMGRSSWLTSRPVERDVEDAVFPACA